MIEDLDLKHWDLLLVRPVTGDSEQYMRVGIGHVIWSGKRPHPHFTFPESERKRWILV